jgi:hypothetical protein
VLHVRQSGRKQKYAGFSASLEEPGVRFPRKSTEESTCRITDSRNVQLRQRSAVFFFSRMQAVQNFAPRLTARSWVNIMLRRDSKVANECGKDAHACRRTSTSWSLNLFDKCWPIFKVAFVPYHRLHGGSWNAEFYRWLLLGCCGRSEA